MEKNRAIPQGYMTIGEAAKKMGITVRTLQYYDRQGLLTPSAESEGGRRLYTDKEMIKLHQILSLKHLGFTLEEIKTHLFSLDTPADVAKILAEQAAVLREKISVLSQSLTAIETLQTEVLQMQSVDFKKYADIILNLQMGNDSYWLIKHLDEQTLDSFRQRFDQRTSLELIETFSRLLDEAILLQKDGTAPESQKGQDLAKEFWDMLMKFTGGDKNMLEKLMQTEALSGPDEEWKLKQKAANTFIEPALGAYFSSINYDPFEEETQ